MVILHGDQNFQKKKKKIKKYFLMKNISKKKKIWFKKQVGFKISLKMNYKKNFIKLTKKMKNLIKKLKININNIQKFKKKIFYLETS